MVSIILLFLHFWAKEEDNIKKKSNVIYWFKCDKIDCEEEYIGESSITFEERYKEHLKAPSPIHEYQNSTGHIISVENFNIIGREDYNMARAVKEAIYIRVKQSHIKQKHWEVQPATSVGWNTTIHSRAKN